MSTNTEQPARLRAVRGATTVERDDGDLIVAATAELLSEMLRANELRPDDVVSLLFTATQDLSAEFPAVGARSLGLAHVPLLCATEIPVPGSVPRCIRVLMHAYTPVAPHELRHIYRGDARSLRSDLA